MYFHCFLFYKWTTPTCRRESFLGSICFCRYIYQAQWTVPALTMNIIPCKSCYFKLYSAIHLPLIEEGDFLLNIVKFISIYAIFHKSICRTNSISNTFIKKFCRVFFRKTISLYRIHFYIRFVNIHAIFLWT